MRESWIACPQDYILRELHADFLLQRLLCINLGDDAETFGFERFSNIFYSLRKRFDCDSSVTKDFVIHFSITSYSPRLSISFFHAFQSTVSSCSISTLPVLKFAFADWIPFVSLHTSSMSTLQDSQCVPLTVIVVFIIPSFVSQRDADR